MRKFNISVRFKDGSTISGTVPAGVLEEIQYAERLYLKTDTGVSLVNAREANVITIDADAAEIKEAVKEARKARCGKDAAQQGLAFHVRGPNFFECLE